ncbi:TetR/AcrR family transcriptional regulator [Robiginitalea sp. M366]|uniref:TetR/AcrR family transcriptional regulator n=1 Tax=Robiginitalea aestuariiviva TaxID=3036903 RepID=UPI00240DEDBE|nr:TetR/AcrR family transcriptional regulator [Robiginitalea aestuariiviva]MDG1571744.1 TetR/AcrR family transcriptional regulator [Robiginitalea aestuariiviva]
MERLIRNLKITINPKVYVKDPESSDLGKRLVEQGIALIDQQGFEHFTFKKLGDLVGSNESSVYRYFENKHKFLLYLSCWYWGWMEYRLVLNTLGASDPEDRLNKALEILTQPVELDMAFAHVDEVALNRIMVNEHAKPFLTKAVDRENKEGYFEPYKRLVERFAEMIGEVNGDYPFARSLASTVLEGSLHQHFLENHLPSLTNCKQPGSITHFFRGLVTSVLNSSEYV